MLLTWDVANFTAWLLKHAVFGKRPQQSVTYLGKEHCMCLAVLNEVSASLLVPLHLPD